MPVTGGRRVATLIAAVLLSTFTTRADEGSRINQGKTAQPSATTTLTAVRLIGDAALPVVELSAAIALPEPKVGVLDGPPRIYLDLPGVKVGGLAPANSLGAVTRVRVALHSVSPLVTRVVIDLADLRGFQLDASQRRAGLIRISVTTVATGHAAASSRVDRPDGVPRAVQSLSGRVPSAGAKPGRSSADSSSRPTPRPATATPDALPVPSPQYRARVAPIVERLETVLGVLESIDERKGVPPDALDAAAGTLALVHDALAAVRPPRDAIVVHDTLRSACTLASTAVSLARAATGHDLPWSASSAAAGARLLLDRVRTTLQPR